MAEAEDGRLVLTVHLKPPKEYKPQDGLALTERNLDDEYSANDSMSRDGSSPKRHLEPRLMMRDKSVVM